MCDPFLGRNFIFQKKDFLHNTFFTQFVLVTLPITILLKILRGRMHPHLKLGGTVRPVPLRLRPWFQKQPLALGPSISEPPKQPSFRNLGPRKMFPSPKLGARSPPLRETEDKRPSSAAATTSLIVINPF